MKRSLPAFVGLLLLSALPTSAQKWDTLAAIPETLTFPVVATVGGKIHIMGGGGTGGATKKHYAYTPATNTWENKADVPYRAQQPAGAAVGGKIHYFGGGYPNTGTPLKDHHVYDPVTNTWSQAADLTAPRAIHYGVGLDGVLYSLAGQGMANLCQTYDAGTNSWATKKNLPDNGFWYGAHIAAAGHIYRFCGGGYTAPNKFAHRYDPSTDTWAALPAFPNATHGLRGAAIGKKIYLAGGYFDFLERDEVWIFDTETQAYSPGTPLPRGRNYHNMVALDSCLYVLGGNNAIDPTVGVQLLRFCPFGAPSPAGETAHPAPLTLFYAAGKLVVQRPEEAIGTSQFDLFDPAGRLVFSEKLPTERSGNIELQLPSLPVGIYFARLQTKQAVFAGKVSVR